MIRALYPVISAFKMPIGKAALIALLGIVIVFAVLAVLVGILTIFKLVFNIKLEKKPSRNAPAASDSVATDEEDDAEVIAAITAAIACMWQEETVTAPFRIKSIRKLK